MDDNYLALIALVEEYKSHSEKSDTEIVRLQKEIIRLNESREFWEIEHAQHLALVRDMEESMIHMDQDLANARAQLAKRDEEINRMRFEIKRTLQIEKDSMGSVSLQLSATKDETRRLKSTNDELRNYAEELEATVNEQQSSWLDLRHYISELEVMAGVAPRVWALKQPNQPLTTRSGSCPKSSINDSMTLLSPCQTRGASVTDDNDVISDIDIEIADSIPERHGVRTDAPHKDGANTPPHNKAKLLAKEAALAALERADAVRPISNRGDGSFGFQRLPPTTEKTTVKSPGSVEKWVYTREELSNGVGSGIKIAILPPPPPIESPLRSNESPSKKPAMANQPPRSDRLPITASKWSIRDAIMPISPSRSESKYSGSPRQMYEDKGSRSYGFSRIEASDRHLELSFRDDSDTDDAAERKQRDSEIRHKEYSSRARMEAGSPRRRFRQPKSAPTLRA